MTFLIFLKGVLMGICDVIPGISGGTIAFITGIYPRLIEAIKSFSPSIIKEFYLFARRKDNHFRQSLEKLDLKFLVPLGLGIGSAIFIGSGILAYLLENYFIYTMSFFIGLILSSSHLIYRKIENHHSFNRLYGILGVAAGLSLAFIIPASVNPTLPYIMLSGFLAISAMFLPGISGAFILLIMGSYEFMLSAIHNIRESGEYILVFLIGAALGAFSISRVISFLFKKDRCKTLYLLLGLVLGSLAIPVKRIITESPGFAQIGYGILLLSLGAATVIVVNKKWKD